MKLLVTGSRGLIGRSVVRLLTLAGHDVRGFDWSYPDHHSHYGDILSAPSLSQAIEGCDGVIHLAAISRVGWAQRDPRLCTLVNETGTANVIQAALECRQRPWLIYASSREVYGEPDELPLTEDAPRTPENLYGRSKLAGEVLLEQLQGGLTYSIVRFANVYGSLADHADRAIPAFLSAALAGKPLTVHGPDNVFDFTHVDDAARCVALAADYLAAEQKSLPPLHVVTGEATSLGTVAQMAVELGGGRSRIIETRGQNGFVSRFAGDPGRAAEWLGFCCETSLKAGLTQLAQDMAEPDDRRHAEFPDWLAMAAE